MPIHPGDGLFLHSQPFQRLRFETHPVGVRWWMVPLPFLAGQQGCYDVGISINGDTQNGWFMEKIPSRNGWWLGVPPYQETFIFAIIYSETYMIVSWILVFCCLNHVQHPFSIPLPLLYHHSIMSNRWPPPRLDGSEHVMPYELLLVIKKPSTNKKQNIGREVTFGSQNEWFHHVFAGF